LYFGKESDVSGPLLRLRYSLPLGSFLAVGLQAHYRDDAPAGGRSQALGVGGEVIVGGMLAAYPIPYLMAGASVDGVFTPAGVSAPDIESGLHPYAWLGIGLPVSAGRTRVLIEARVALGAGGPLSSILLGLGSDPGHDEGGPLMRPAFFSIRTSTLVGASTAYEQDDDFRGYALAYDHPLSWQRISVRGGIGINFVRFALDGRVWSTSAVELTAATPFSILSGVERRLGLALVPEAGVLVFVEPSTQVFPAAGLGAELTFDIGNAGIVGGLSRLVSGGPAGLLSAWQPWVGLRLKI
jgi:hypothetical protein